ncbi:hypothetical protein QAD02_023180 [Eretmocerus hayati]|uniref:Uncharacterized protein n=1 Tax=Eretmocerus hayati TaxID=131215 RepID=A0ACC2PX85_9HYME|nr:hypothetical protein QAD02_023180 [Eretmocerus hayati]
MYDTVAELITALKNFYAPASSVVQLLGELGKQYQAENETVVAFANRLRDFGKRILGAYKSENNDVLAESTRTQVQKSLADCFKRGLLPEIESRLTIAGDAMVGDLIKSAIEIERRLATQRELRGPPPLSIPSAPQQRVLTVEMRIRLLIDTGSEGNILKKESLPPTAILDWSKMVQLCGIGVTPIKASGIAEIKFLENLTPFIIVDRIFPFEFDGVLGSRLFWENAVTIDFRNNYSSAGNIVVKFCLDLNPNSVVKKITNVGRLRSPILPFIDVTVFHSSPQISFLIDTGAEVSILKFTFVPIDCNIDYTRKVWLVGIGAKVTQTLASANYLQIFWVLGIPRGVR